LRAPQRDGRGATSSSVTARSLGGVELTRAAPATVPGPLDDRLYDLVESRFRRVVESEPTYATLLGIHAWDEHLPDPSRERVLGDIERATAMGCNKSPVSHG